MKYFKLITFLLSFAICSCSTNQSKEFLSEFAAKAVFDKEFDIEYSANQCVKVKNNCTFNGAYTEWKQDNGELACRCIKNQ